jgi:alpha-glucosidase
MLAGAGDNTICYFAPRVTEKMGGHVSQLAKAVMLYSPWQFLYWYDRPQGSPGRTGGAGSSEGYIQDVPELEFFENIPTVWDETRVIEGKIGEYATMARKSGNDWFLGSLTGNAAKTVQFNLDFLDENSEYEAIVYSHDPDAESFTKVKVETRKVNLDSVLEFEVGVNSGLAVHFRKI